MLGKIEGRRRRGQERMRWLDGITINGHEFEQSPGDSEGQGSLACCSSWVHKESDMTLRLNSSVYVNPKLFRSRLFGCKSGST